jgi:hypothetical protein
MKIEFYTPQVGCFNQTTYFKESGSNKFIPLKSMDINTQKIIYLIFQDNSIINKYIHTLKSKGITDRLQILESVVGKYFSKLDHVWDIDNEILHFETKRN